jgi:hypothetical protein
MRTDLHKALVIDFESVLDSNGGWFPVEIGISDIHGATRSLFIRPEPDWLPGKPNWGSQAENLKAAMESKARAPELAKWVRQITSGRPVFSDALFVDQPMLNRLTGEPHISLEGFFPLVDDLKARFGISHDEVNAWIVEIDETRGPAHRAGEDSRVRAVLLARMLKECAARRKMSP